MLIGTFLYTTRRLQVCIKPFIGIIFRVPPSTPSPVLILMGTLLPFIEPPGSPLSAGRSGVNPRGQRSQDHRLHNASDC